MKVTIFAKRKRKADGTPFTVFIGKLTRKSGEEQTVTVKFKEDECGKPNPADCPLIVDIPKESANMGIKHYVREDTGEPAERFELWVSAWNATGEKYVDHSLDDFED